MAYGVLMNAYWGLAYVKQHVQLRERSWLEVLVSVTLVMALPDPWKANMISSTAAKMLKSVY